MNSLQDMLNASLTGIFESGKAREIVDASVEKMLREIVGNVTRSYSDFGKTLEAKLSEHLKVDFEKLDFPQYNHLVTQVVQRALRHLLQEDAAKQLEADLTEMLAGEIPKEITISKLVKQLKEWAREDVYEARGKYAVTAIVETTEHNSRWVSLDPLPDQRKHSCRIQMLLNNDGALQLVRFGGKDIDKTLFLGGLHGFERTIFQMYTAKTRLVIDTEEPDVEQPEGGEV